MMYISIGSKSYEFKNQWNELSKKQLIQLFKIIEKKDESSIQVLIKIFRVLCKCSLWRLIRNSDDVEANLHRVEWVFDTELGGLLTNPIKSFKGFYGPDADFMNLETREFFWAQDFFKKYHLEGNEMALNQMVATLYRPGKKHYDYKRNPDGDLREAYNPNLTDQYADKISNWPKGVKLAVVKWFEDCYVSLKNRYPEAFEGGTGDPARFDFYSLMTNVSGRGNHGKFADVEKMNIHVFFMELVEMILIDRQNRK